MTSYRYNAHLGIIINLYISVLQNALNAASSLQAMALNETVLNPIPKLSINYVVLWENMAVLFYVSCLLKRRSAKIC